MRQLLTVVVVLALAVGVVIEVGSPIWTRTELAGAAGDAANAGAREYFSTHDIPASSTAASDAAAVRGAHLDNFSFLRDGQVHVTVSRRAKSYVLCRYSRFKSWYEVSASAAATPQQ
jgi:Flp pilus assembly protein TadG